MNLSAARSDSQCYLRVLANWGLGLAGLPLAVTDDEPPPTAPAPLAETLTPIAAH